MIGSGGARSRPGRTGPRIRRPIAPAIAVLTATLAIGGCLDVALPSAAPSPTRTPEPTPTTTIYELGQTVWYEGLLVHVDRAVATLDQRGGPVELSLTVENPSTEDADLRATIYLVVDGASVEPTRESRIPTIPAAGFVPALLTYELQGIASAGDAVVRVGAAPEHVGLVPLTSAGVAAVTLEPRELDLSGSGRAGDLRLTLRDGVLRWDLPDWSLELPADRQALTVTYDASCVGNPPGGCAFTGESVALRLPDGSEIDPRADGHSQSVELIGAGKTKRRLFSRFEIPASVSGELALVVIDGSERQTITLVIPA